MYKQQIQYVLIPETTLPIIKEKLGEVNSSLSKGKLKLEKVLIIFGYMLNRIHKAKDEDLDRGHLAICSIELKNLYDEHYRCTDILMESNIFSKINYSNQNHKCNRYALHTDYLMDNLIPLNISKSKNTTEVNFKVACDENSNKKYKYLIKHFKGITIKSTAAKEYINNLLKQKEIEEEQYSSYNYNIDTIKLRNFYFRTPDTDKRFHTNLTSFPKKLRKFLSYEGKPLINLDAKNSQPYFLAVIINIILNKDKSTLDGLKHILKSVKSKKAKKPTNYYSRIAELFDVPFDNKELYSYINSVCNGNYYELLVQKLEPYFEYEGGLLVKEKYNKKTGEIEKDDFETKRKYAKDSSMQIFFSSEKSPVKDVTFFKNEFPAIWKLTKYLKGNESSNFAALLQNLEAHLIIDKITKKANKKFNAPLFTIHDSIATTKEYVDDIKFLILQVLSETVKLTPKIDVEYW